MGVGVGRRKPREGGREASRKWVWNKKKRGEERFRVEMQASSREEVRRAKGWEGEVRRESKGECWGRVEG